MKRVLFLILAVVIFISMFTGCGASSRAKQTSAVAPGIAQTEVAQAGEALYDQAAPAVAPSAPAPESPKDGSSYNSSVGVESLAGGGDFTQDVSNAILAERKVIRSANISVEVENFDDAYGKIDNLILGIGYIQSTNINTNKIAVDDGYKLIRSGNIVIRVDREKFDKILNSLKGIGEVTNWSINGEDVTDKYFDIESRLRLLKTEESKIEEYLNKLTDLDMIYKTESKLTEIRYQIEALTGNLKKMSDLVELSTITININEKYPDSVNPAKPKTYWDRLLKSLWDSMKGVVSFAGELVIFIISALPVIILLGVFTVIGLLIYRRVKKGKGQL